MSYAVRLILVAILAAAPLGCSFFRPGKTIASNPVAADTLTAQKAPAESTLATARGREPPAVPVSSTPAPAPVPAAEKEPAPSDKPRDRPDTSAPVLTVRLTAQEEVALRQRIASDIEKASDALVQVRRYTLTSQQADNLALAEDFLTGAVAAKSTDLVRASTLAEKARVLAMDLKSEVVK
jgi:hypothetical protein